MNKERILKLAKYLVVEPERYDQRNYFHEMLGDVQYDGSDAYDCDTPACVAGHAIFLFGTAEEKEWINSDPFCKGWRTEETAQQLLELNFEDAKDLFYADPFHSNGTLYPTAEQAVRTLNHFAETSEVDWELSQ